MEVYKPIKGYEGLYEISNMGNVRSIRNNKILKPATDKYGYLYVVFSVNQERKTLKVHRLVAETFIENSESKATVDHKNTIKKDNRVENLKWATNKEQSQNPITYKKLCRNALEKIPKLIEASINRDYGRKKVRVTYPDGTVVITKSLKEAALEVKRSQGRVSEILNRKRNQNKEFHLEWA